MVALLAISIISEEEYAKIEGIIAKLVARCSLYHEFYVVYFGFIKVKTDLQHLLLNCTVVIITH